jgi:hypothetical protein
MGGPNVNQFLLITHYFFRGLFIMKKLIIGIGFTAFMAVTGLQAGNEFLEQLQVVEKWLDENPIAKISEQSTGSDLFTKVGMFVARNKECGTEILKQQYPRVNAQFQAYQAKLASSAIKASATPTLKACAQMISTLPKRAQKSFFAQTRDFVKQHPKMTVAAVFTLTAATAAVVYATCPNVRNTVNSHAQMASDYVAQTVIPSVSRFFSETASSAWNATTTLFSGLRNQQPTSAQQAAAQAARQAAIDTTQAMFETSAREAAQKVMIAHDALLQAQDNLQSENMTANIANTALENAKSILQQPLNTFDCSPHLSWYQDNFAYKWLKPATYRDICTAAREKIAQPLIAAAQNIYDRRHAILGGAQDSFNAALAAYNKIKA